MPFMQFKKNIRDIKRLEQIVGVFVKYGFGYLVEKIHLPSGISGAEPKEDLFHLSPEVRLRKVLEELGPTFIKLGQMLSLRPEILPYPFCKELEKLQDDVPGVEFEKIRAVIEDEFRKPINKVFKDFPRESLASASLAQVYQVKLKNEEVIVKVRKPGVEEIIMGDLEILEFLTSLLDRHWKGAGSYNPKGVLEEFKIYILRELNFNNELVHIERFKKNFRHSTTVCFPKVYKKFCTNKVLVMEKIKGVKISDLKRIRQLSLEPKAIAGVLADCILKQIFVDGYFHADPHPGNIFVQKDGRVCFLDFGIVGRINEDKKFKLADILIAGIERDADRIIELFRELGALEHTQDAKLRLSLEEMLDKYYGVTLEEFAMDDFFKDLVKIISENKVKILPDYFLLIKTIGMVEVVGKMLDEHFNIAVRTQKFVEGLIREKYSAGQITGRLKKFSKNTFDLLQNFPSDVTAIVNKVKKGELKVGFVHSNLENLISALDKVSARVSFSLIIAALIIGSSIIINSSKETLFGHAHHLGIVGYIMAAILGVWLLVNILRSGHL